MEDLDEKGSSPAADADLNDAPVVLYILRGLVGGFLGLIVGGIIVPVVLATVVLFLLNDLGGPGFWVMIAIPSGILGSIGGASLLCSVNAPQRMESDEKGDEI